MKRPYRLPMLYVDVSKHNDDNKSKQKLFACIHHSMTTATTCRGTQSRRSEAGEALRNRVVCQVSNSAVTFLGFQWHLL